LAGKYGWKPNDMRKNYSLVYILFGVVAILDIFVAFFFSEIRIFTKPLLMPLLMLGYYLEVKPLKDFSKILLWGLFFSWVGDILLMLEASNGSFFIGGLLAFLTAHLLYIRYFSKTKSAYESYLKSRPIMLLAVLVYVIELLYILWPYLGGMKLPVVVYACVIGTMLAFALWQFGKLEKKTSLLFIGGAVFFVISDSLLAISKFKDQFPLSDILIMFTYCLAQYLLARGSARHLETSFTNVND
jgi:uncharacterized membrane protein YhhN